MKSSDTLDRTQKMWEAYWKSRGIEERNRLVEHYLPLVRSIAGKMCRSLPGQVEMEEVVSAGSIGLMHAVEAFSPKRKVKFETYCYYRIRGAILDELRLEDHASRIVRRRTRKWEAAVAAFEACHGRPASEDELRRSMKLGKRQFDRCKRDARASRNVSLSMEHNGVELGDTLRIYAGDEEAANPPQHNAELSELRERAIRLLPQPESTVVELYYFKDKSMKEIGEELDLSLSRVSQIHSSAMARMRWLDERPTRAAA